MTCPKCRKGEMEATTEVYHGGPYGEHTYRIDDVPMQQCRDCDHLVLEPYVRRFFQHLDDWMKQKNKTQLTFEELKQLRPECD